MYFMYIFAIFILFDYLFIFFYFEYLSCSLYHVICICVFRVIYLSESHLQVIFISMISLHCKNRPSRKRMSSLTFIILCLNQQLNIPIHFIVISFIICRRYPLWYFIVINRCIFSETTAVFYDRI